MVRHFFLTLLVGSSCARCRASEGRPETVSTAWLNGEVEPEVTGPVHGGTLVIRSMVEPATLNALEGNTSRETWTLRITRQLVTESLLTIDPSTYALVPQLAERFAESADHRRSTFWLRKGVAFHDGSAFSARDVVATFEAVLDQDRPTAAIRQNFSGLESVHSLDDSTVELHWNQPSPFALRQVAQLPILSARQLAGDWKGLSSQPVGTGPYQVERWERGSRVELRRVGEAFVDRIVFRFVKDHGSAAALLEKGEFDLMTAVQPALWRAMEAPDPKYAWARTDYRRLMSVDNSYSYIAWNQALPLFREMNVRRALAHLYPSELVARAVDLQLETPTTCPYWALGPQCDASVRPVEPSVAVARGLLADAGFVEVDSSGTRMRDGVPLAFSFLLPTTSVRLGRLIPLLQEQARAAGVRMTVEPVDVATLGARVNARAFEAVSRVWTESDIESDQFGTFHSSARDGGSNFVGYSSPEADRLMEQIRAEWDEGKRRELERALHRKLYEDQPYLFMTARRSLDLAKRRVHGLVPSLMWYDLRRVWVVDGPSGDDRHARE